jgi:Fe-S-cluster-containing hydrogenase component 2
MCVESCPVQAIDKETKLINYDKCIECMCCHELCLHKAVQLKKSNPVAGAMIKLFGGKYK